MAILFLDFGTFVNGFGHGVKKSILPAKEVKSIIARILDHLYHRGLVRCVLSFKTCVKYQTKAVSYPPKYLNDMSLLGTVGGDRCGWNDAGESRGIFILL